MLSQSQIVSLIDCLVAVYFTLSCILSSWPSVCFSLLLSLKISPECLPHCTRRNQASLSSEFVVYLINSMFFCFCSLRCGCVLPFQSVLPYYVATKLSKIRKPTLDKPSAETYVKSAIQTVGLQSRTTGYLIHSLMVCGFPSLQSVLWFGVFFPTESRNSV